MKNFKLAFLVLAVIIIILCAATTKAKADDSVLTTSPACPFISDGIWVEIDISSQTLNIKNGDEILLTTPVVTGTLYSHDTPLGLYEVLSKESSRYLNGYNEDGSTYHCWVDYWIPFFGGYGIHDASWRYEFGGDIYTYSGSHGCVNLPSDIASEVYNYVEVGTPVYVH